MVSGGGRMTFEELENEVLKLPVDRRAELVRALILSLDADQEADPEIQQAWIEEAERRYQDYVDGKTTPVPGEEAFRRVRASLR
jgi:putative addiction module component (TIGR02574 family)